MKQQRAERTLGAKPCDGRATLEALLDLAHLHDAVSAVDCAFEGRARAVSVRGPRWRAGGATHCLPWRAAFAAPWYGPAGRRLCSRA
jgi:hypothetical protein